MRSPKRKIKIPPNRGQKYILSIYGTTMKPPLKFHYSMDTSVKYSLKVYNFLGHT